METHKNLVVWQKSIAFVTVVYEFTRSFPKDEIYGMVSQIRRAANRSERNHAHVN